MWLSFTAGKEGRVEATVASSTRYRGMALREILANHPIPLLIHPALSFRKLATAAPYGVWRCQDFPFAPQLIPSWGGWNCIWSYLNADRECRGCSTAMWFRVHQATATIPTSIFSQRMGLLAAIVSSGSQLYGFQRDLTSFSLPNSVNEAFWVNRGNVACTLYTSASVIEYTW